MPPDLNADTLPAETPRETPRVRRSITCVTPPQDSSANAMQDLMAFRAKYAAFQQRSRRSGYIVNK